MERMNKKERNYLLLELIQYALQTHKSQIAKDKNKLEALSSLIDWTLQADKEDLETIYPIIEKAEKETSNHFHLKELKERGLKDEK